MRTLNRRTGYGLASAVLALGLSACAATHAPSPVPTPSPSPTPAPQGIASSTALQNLDLVVGLERATGRSGKLVAIGGYASPGTGRIGPGSLWDYIFAGVGRDIFGWTVSSEGKVHYAGPAIDLLGLDLTDIRDGVRLDSDRAVEIALQSGGQAFVDRYPAALARVNCRFQGRVVTWQVSFRDSASTLCEPEFWINATDGRLMARELSCL